MAALWIHGQTLVVDPLVHPAAEQGSQGQADQAGKDGADGDFAEHAAINPDSFERHRNAGRFSVAPVGDTRKLGNDGCQNWENAVARNQLPMTVLTSLLGESFVTIDRPTGERQSSPVVCSR